MSDEQEDIIVDRAEDLDDTEEQAIAEDKVDKDATDMTEEEDFSTQGRYLTNQKQLDATQLYLNEIGFSPLLTPEEEVYFARLARKGEEAGRKRMIESNLRLVVKIARKGQGIANTA